MIFLCLILMFWPRESDNLFYVFTLSIRTTVLGGFSFLIDIPRKPVRLTGTRSRPHGSLGAGGVDLGATKGSLMAHNDCAWDRVISALGLLYKQNCCDKQCITMSFVLFENNLCFLQQMPNDVNWMTRWICDFLHISLWREHCQCVHCMVCLI